jgi:hypothetical protein
MPTLIPVDHDPFSDAKGTALQLIPVDHDPFADGAGTAPNPIPVDYDPFAGRAAAGPSLIPVNYDPFSDTNAAPKLIPIDHDPFASGAGTALRLVPGDYDPFAGTAAAGPSLIPVNYDPFSGTNAAPKLIPVDHDPFADGPGRPLHLVPVDYDPFAAPDLSIDARSPSPQANAQVGNPYSPQSPAQIADHSFLQSPSGFGAAAAAPPPSQPDLGSRSRDNLPLSFLRSAAPTFPVSSGKFGKLPGSDSPYLANTLSPPFGYAAGSVAQNATPAAAVSTPDDSQPAVILASDDQKRLQRQLDLFDQNAFGTVPWRPTIWNQFDSPSWSVPRPLRPGYFVSQGVQPLADWLRSAVGQGKLSAQEAAAVQNNVSSPEVAERLASIFRAALPKFDGKTTYGILVTNEGDVVRFINGGRDPRYSNYESAAHVEGKAAIWMRDHGSSGGVLYHNNTGGTCGYCDSHLETLLPEGATLRVMPPQDASEKNAKAIARPEEYVGNSKTPKAP